MAEEKPVNALIVSKEAAKPLAPIPENGDSSKAITPFGDRDPYQGVASKPFKASAQDILQAPIDAADVEIRPDGIVYLPEIKYRRALMRAFGAGGWALVPRGEITMIENILIREYALYVDGRFASEARGEQEYFPNNPKMTYATAAEAVKSNALMRCCKDLGIAGELWDPGFIERWKAAHAVKVERLKQANPKNRYAWRRKDRQPFYDEVGMPPANASDSSVVNPEPPPETPEIENPWIGSLSEVTAKEFTMKQGKRAGQKGTVWRVTAASGAYFGTFDPAFADVAKQLAKTGEKAIIHWEPSQYGPTVKAIAPDGLEGSAE